MCTGLPHSMRIFHLASNNILAYRAIYFVTIFCGDIIIITIVNHFLFVLHFVTNNKNDYHSYCDVYTSSCIILLYHLYILNRNLTTLPTCCSDSQVCLSVHVYMVNR